MWIATQSALITASQLASPDDRTCREYALHALSNLAHDKENKKPMWIATQAALVTASQLASPTDWMCRKYAIGAILRLSYNAANKRPMWIATRAALVTASQLDTSADRECRASALANLAADATCVVDMIANYSVDITAAALAATLLDSCDTNASVRRGGTRLLQMLRQASTVGVPPTPSSAAASADTATGSSSSERSAGESAFRQTTRGGGARFKPLPTVPTVSLKTSAETRAILLADWLATATAIVGDNKKTTNAEIAGMESALVATVVKATAEHAVRVDKATSDHAARIAKADVDRKARTDSSLRQLESTKSAAQTQHALGLESRKRTSRMQEAELAEIEAAYKDTVATIAAAGTTASSGRKRKTAVESTPPPAKRGKGAATTPPDSAAAAAAELLVVPERERPAAHMCPLTLETMVNPVIAIDGYTYEREAIEKWFEKHATSPMTGMELSSTDVLPNMIAKQLILDWEP
jgi:hypothetical protein